MIAWIKSNILILVLSNIFVLFGCTNQGLNSDSNEKEYFDTLILKGKNNDNLYYLCYKENHQYSFVKSTNGYELSRIGKMNINYVFEYLNLSKDTLTNTVNYIELDSLYNRDSVLIKVVSSNRIDSSLIKLISNERNEILFSKKVYRDNISLPKKYFKTTGVNIEITAFYNLDAKFLPDSLKNLGSIIKSENIYTYSAFYLYKNQMKVILREAIEKTKNLKL